MKSLIMLVALLLIGQVHAQTVGFFSQTANSEDGYVLFSPITSTTVYLIDKCGKQVHSWNTSHRPGLSVYLQPDGTLLRPGNLNNPVFGSGGGGGGIIEQFDWDGTLTWSYNMSTGTTCQHHDVCRLPNGNIIAIAWELKTHPVAVAAGRDSSFAGAVWTEKLVELQPSGSSSATILWEWNAWDHIVQDFNNTVPNYGVVADHPELIDINYHTGSSAPSDWLHINSVVYNPYLDQLMVSSHNFSEVWILDHSTTTAEAATHSGGAHGKGGDLLYRWGNPAAYGAGTVTDRVFYGQHNAHWIEAGLPDSGKVMVFNNGSSRPGGNYSSIDVFDPPVGAAGDYAYTTGTSYLPAALSWTYEAPTPTDFFSMNISGAQRLPGGNTIICTGTSGVLFEIDTDKNTAWQYIVPVNASGPIAQGTTPTMNSTFRCTWYPLNYSGFAGHTLTPGDPIELSPLPYTCTTTGVSHASLSIARFSVVNPFDNSITLSSSEDLTHASLTLTDVTGRICAAWPGCSIPSGRSIRLTVNPGLPAGIYILRVTAKNAQASLKLVKE